MAVEDRDPDRCRRHRDGVVLHDLLRLVDHLHLFLRVAVVKEDVDVGKTVKGYLMRIDLLLDLLLFVDGQDLALQFLDGLLSGTGDRLIGGDDDPLDPRRVVERFQDDHHLDGGTVRVRDDVLLRIPSIACSFTSGTTRGTSVPS